jgi:hypothetical protein
MAGLEAFPFWHNAQSCSHIAIIVKAFIEGSSEIGWRPEMVPVHTVGEVRSPTTSHGLNSETAVAGREEPETLGRYPSSQTWAVQVPYAVLT